MNYLSLSVDAVPIVGKALTPQYPDNYVDAYHTLFSGTGIHFSNEGNSISRESYIKGHCFYIFDLTLDLSANCKTHWNLIKQGTMRLEFRFENMI